MRTWEQAGETIRLPGAVGIQAMAFAPDGRRVAIGVQLEDRYEVHELDVVARGTRRAVVARRPEAGRASCRR